MKEIDVKERAALAVEQFRVGYNCAQSVLLAYADLYPIEIETIKKIGAPLGGGVSRLREICGAVSAMSVILGLEKSVVDPTDEKGKTDLYDTVQHAAFQYKERMGSYICADLLAIKRVPQPPRPDDRNAAYYAQRPCAYCVAVAAEILGNELLSIQKSRNSLIEPDKL